MENLSELFQKLSLSANSGNLGVVEKVNYGMELMAKIMEITSKIADLNSIFKNIVRQKSLSFFFDSCKKHQWFQRVFVKMIW